MHVGGGMGAAQLYACANVCVGSRICRYTGALHNIDASAQHTCSGVMALPPACTLKDTCVLCTGVVYRESKYVWVGTEGVCVAHVYAVVCLCVLVYTPTTPHNTKHMFHVCIQMHVYIQTTTQHVWAMSHDALTSSTTVPLAPQGIALRHTCTTHPTAWYKQWGAHAVHIAALVLKHHTHTRYTTHTCTQQIHTNNSTIHTRDVSPTYTPNAPHMHPTHITYTHHIHTSHTHTHTHLDTASVCQHQCTRQLGRVGQGCGAATGSTDRHIHQRGGVCHLYAVCQTGTHPSNTIAAVLGAHLNAVG